MEIGCVSARCIVAEHGSFRKVERLLLDDCWFLFRTYIELSLLVKVSSATFAPYCFANPSMNGSNIIGNFGQIEGGSDG